MNNLIWIIWIVSIAYCLHKIYSNTGKRSLDGVIGNTPAFDVFAVLVFAPLFAVIDLGVTWYKKYYYNKNK